MVGSIVDHILTLVGARDRAVLTSATIARVRGVTGGGA